MHENEQLKQIENQNTTTVRIENYDNPEQKLTKTRVINCEERCLLN